MIEKLNLSRGYQSLPTPVAYLSPPFGDKKSESFWGKIFKSSKMKKPNMVAVIYKRLNGVAEPMYVMVDIENMITIEGKKYHPRHDCRYFLQVGKEKLPFMIIEEDRLIPDGTSEYYLKTLDQEKIIAELQNTAIKAIQHAEIVRMEGLEKKPMNTKAIIIFIILGIIGLALLKNYV